jgi:hypothetical protein
MKLVTLFVLVVLSFFITSATTEHMNAQDIKKPQDTVVLSKGSKLGQVTFSHINHTTKNYSVDGTKPVACVECHHTAQPAAEATKDPLHKTVWPADRTTTLTAELLEKDANALGAKCSDCHTAPETKPKLLPAIPQVKFEGSEEMTVMTNQQAFHHNCGGCHDGAVKARPSLSPAPPTSKKCLVCHKKAAA